MLKPAFLKFIIKYLYLIIWWVLYIKLANKSVFIPFLFAYIMSEAMLKARSIEPDEAATDTASPVATLYTRIVSGIIF